MTENAEVNPALSPMISENKVESEAKQPELVTLHQHQLNDLLKEQRDRGYRKAQQELQPQIQSQSQPMAQTMGGMAQAPNPDEIKRLVDEQLAEHSRLMQGQQIVNSFMGKMTAGRDKYPDFEQKIGMFGDLKNIPEIVQLAAHVDNTHDVMYDLANNPHKLASLLTTARSTPALAFEEMQNLSRSIKANQDALSQSQPSEPLSQLKSSVKTDNGTKNTSISYFKNKYRA